MRAENQRREFRALTRPEIRCDDVARGRIGRATGWERAKSWAGRNALLAVAAAFLAAVVLGIAAKLVWKI